MAEARFTRKSQVLVSERTCGFESHYPHMAMTDEERRTYDREYYHRTRRPKLVEYLGGKCAVCGTTEDLQFDHIDPEDKSFDIKGRLTLSDEVKAELDKCQLLCGPHHREKSAREQSGFEHGTTYAWMKKKCDCAVCYAAKRIWHDDRNAQRRTGKRGPYKRRF